MNSSNKIGLLNYTFERHMTYRCPVIQPSISGPQKSQQYIATHIRVYKTTIIMCRRSLWRTKQFYEMGRILKQFRNKIVQT